MDKGTPFAYIVQSRRNCLVQYKFGITMPGRLAITWSAHSAGKWLLLKFNAILAVSVFAYQADPEHQEIF